MTKKTQTKAADLPPDVKVSDLKWPEMGHGLGYEKVKELGLESTSLLFFYCEGRNDFGWVLTTLLISNPSRRQAAGTPARYYGVQVADGRTCRVGKGPHVTKEVTVYLSKDNIDRLARYVELYKKGASDAGSIRDRISTRRAQGQLYRAAGRTMWNW